MDEAIHHGRRRRGAMMGTLDDIPGIGPYIPQRPPDAPPPPPLQPGEAEFRALVRRLGIPVSQDSAPCRFRIEVPDEGKPRINGEIITPPNTYGRESGLRIPDPWRAPPRYRIEAIGAGVPELEPREGWVTQMIPLHAEIGHNMLMQLWHVIVRPPETPLYAELRWRPGDDAEPSISGWPERRPPGPEITQAWQALGVIREIRSHAGRKPLEDEPWDYWREQADKAIRLRSSGYTWEQVRGNIGIPIGTLREWVRRRRRELGK